MEFLRILIRALEEMAQGSTAFKSQEINKTHV
jgi:hypothetical protein